MNDKSETIAKTKEILKFLENTDIIIGVEALLGAVMTIIINYSENEERGVHNTCEVLTHYAQQLLDKEYGKMPNE